MSRRRRGFTVLELVSALSLSALLLLTAVAAFGTLQRLATATQRRALEYNEHASGYHLLRELLATTQVGLSRSDRFFGDERGVTTLALCRTGGGWRERCRVSIALAAVGDRTEVRWSAGLAMPEALLAVDGVAEFRYLGPDGRGTDWQSSWGSGVGAPRLVALVASSDTLFFGVGSR